MFDSVLVGPRLQEKGRGKIVFAVWLGVLGRHYISSALIQDVATGYGYGLRGELHGELGILLLSALQDICGAGCLLRALSSSGG